MLLAAATASSAESTTSLRGTGRPAEARSWFVSFFVLRDIDRERGCHGGHRCADPLLVPALTELHQRLLVEPDERYVSAGGFVEDRLGRRAERSALGEPDQALELRREVESRVRSDQMIDEPNGDATRFEPNLLFPVPEDDVVAPGGSRPPGLPPVDLCARLALQLDRDVLRDVAGPRALEQPFAEPAGVSPGARMLTDAGNDREKRVGEAFDRVGGPELERAEIDEQLDRGLVGVVVGAAEHALLNDREVGSELRSFRVGEPARPLDLF
jgi:hypothetical protein